MAKVNEQIKLKIKPISQDALLSSIRNKILLFSLIGSVILINFTLSNKFYFILYDLYDFIHKYYFLGNRIIYFIEYDLQLHVDFYQRTYIAFAIIIFLLTTLIISKIRIYTILGLAFVLITVLNFTSLGKPNIIAYQQAAFEKVEARNYYSWIELILKDEAISDSVYTNFKYIVGDSLPRDIKFKFVPNISKTSLSLRNNSYYFLKSDILDTETKNYVKKKIKEGVYEANFKR